MDSQDVPHVAYQNLTGGVKTISYATLNVTATQISGNNVWVIETVDTNLGDTAGSWLSIDLDSQDRPHISYYSGDTKNSLRYATKNSTGWSNHTIDTGYRLGWFSARGLIPPTIPTSPTLNWGEMHSSTLCTMVPAGTPKMLTGWSDKKGLQLALSAADVPHLCYFDQNLLQLGHATYSGSSWVKETNVLSDDLDLDTSLPEVDNGHRS